MRGTGDMKRAVSTYPGAVKAPLLPMEKKKWMKKRPSACVRTQKPVVAENDNGTVGASISIAESSEVAVA